MIGFILFIVSTILKMLVAPFAYLYGTIVSLKRKEWHYWHFNLAIAKDQYGNAVCRYLFNWLLIKKEGYKFGNIDETISSVLGKNKRDNTLKSLGKFIDKTLNRLDNNHSLNSIDETIK